MNSLRTESLITSYLQAGLFLFLGLRCIVAWVRARDKTSAHLAAATAFFGLNSLIGAINTSLYDTFKGQAAPRWVSVVTSIMIQVAIYFFLVFLSDFIKFPVVLKGLVIVATLFNIVTAVIERPGIKFENGRLLTLKVHNPIPYRGYLWYVIIYFAIVFAVLGVSFLIYGYRVRALARLRMVLIGSGFTLLFLVIGLLPLLIFGNPSASTITNVYKIILYIALPSAPLLLVGFAPPKFISNRYAS